MAKPAEKNEYSYLISDWSMLPNYFSNGPNVAANTDLKIAVVELSHY